MKTTQSCLSHLLKSSSFQPLKISGCRHFSFSKLHLFANTTWSEPFGDVAQTGFKSLVHLSKMKQIKRNIDNMICIWLKLYVNLYFLISQHNVPMMQNIAKKEGIIFYLNLDYVPNNGCAWTKIRTYHKYKQHERSFYCSVKFRILFPTNLGLR